MGWETEIYLGTGYWSRFMGFIQFDVKFLHSQSVCGLTSIISIVLVSDWGDPQNSNRAKGEDFQIRVSFVDFSITQIPLNCWCKKMKNVVRCPVKIIPLLTFAFHLLGYLLADNNNLLVAFGIAVAIHVRLTGCCCHDHSTSLTWSSKVGMNSTVIWPHTCVSPPSEVAVQV